ncbi:hypothetical protein EW146_g4977 [Bondarzewia mesenterica]|uniref:Uncharacterized protein n=1 Tax=Bondarzewia mesenterica TaxID=1095465 RepID=A0A4S4LST3_9AGAM|nr:hypothetical protein EW146_g4977 [Bondarzewia mesenterica]
MTFTMSGSNGSGSRLAADVPPPVPPLPKNIPMSARMKPLPPSPSVPSSLPRRDTSTERRQRRYSGHNTPSMSMPRQKKKKKQDDVLKPPDLRKVPDLLPIFLEMVR